MFRSPVVGAFCDPAMIFKIGEDALELKIGSDDWVKIYLVSKSGVNTFLGSDIKSVIFNRLSNLSSSATFNQEGIGVINGVSYNPVCILTLMEAHCSIYAERRDLDIRIFIENELGEVISDNYVSYDTLSSWRLA